MDNFWVGAWLALTDFKTDNRSRGGSSGSSGSSSGTRRRGGYDPNQARGENGRWVETSSSSDDEPLFDPNSAIGRAHAREEEAKRAKQQSAETRTKPLPKDVEATELGRGGFLYTHETKEGNSLSVEIMPTGDENSKKVDFSINDSYDKDDALSTKERNSMSIKLAKIMQHDASKREDGERYETRAYTDDSEEYGAVRAYAYEKIANFSRPVDGEPGGNQYAIVKNGKLMPDMDRIKEELDDYEPQEREWVATFAEQNASEYRRIANEYRRSQSR